MTEDTDIPWRNCVVTWDDNSYEIAGPFESFEQLASYGLRWDAETGSMNWQSVYIADPHAPPVVRPAPYHNQTGDHPSHPYVLLFGPSPFEIVGPFVSIDDRREFTELWEKQNPDEIWAGIKLADPHAQPEVIKPTVENCAPLFPPGITTKRQYLNKIITDLDNLAITSGLYKTEAYEKVVKHLQTCRDIIAA